MKPIPIRPLLLVAAASLTGSLAAGADDNIHVLKFSDPSRPGVVKLSLGRGDLHVRGTTTNEVSVKTAVKASSAKPRKDGLRVISAASSFSFKESDNVITIDAAGVDPHRSNADFQLTLPANTSLVVQNAWGGSIQCTALQGDIEINSMHGDIKLEDVSGGVVVSTMNGEIHANIRELRDGKPLSFTSMNGEVVLRVPEAAKANVRLRTQNGSVLTDFEESSLVTKAETTAGVARSRTFEVRGGKVLTAEVQEAIREATQLSASAIREALEAVKAGLEEARLDSEEARRSFEDARRDLERVRRDKEREHRDAERKAAEAVPQAPAAPKPPKASHPMVPPKPPIATLTGGKLVTGTLNGGGPEISVATMNGDVILRKIAAAK
jgi:DUF4097 and DUF4098 domain-containing protein YvlB